MAPTGLLLPAGDLPCNPSSQDLLDHPVRGVSWVPFKTPVVLKPVLDSDVSPQALDLFRRLVSLARRNGCACVNRLETLAEMFHHKERATRYALAELIAAGWIERRQTRRGGKSQLFFRPLARLVKPSDCRLPCRLPPAKLQVAPPAPYKKVPEGKEETTNTQPAAHPETPVVVPAPTAVSSEALALLASLGFSESACRALARLGELPRLQRAVKAYRGADRDKIHNPVGWLAAAIRESWAPNLPPGAHPSDRGERAVKVVCAPPGFTLRRKESPLPPQSIDRLPPALQVRLRQGMRRAV